MDKLRHRSDLFGAKRHAKRTRKDARLRSQYGISELELDDMIRDQGGLCDICHVRFGDVHENRPNVDHDHCTGAVRGILCHTCNVGIGCFSDNPKTLVDAAGYLIKHGR